jgi:hypothetical protein
MTRALAAVVAAAVVLAGCGGGSGGSGGSGGGADRVALDRADKALAGRPGDPQAMEAVIRAAYRGASNRTDSAGTGNFEADARPYLDRAAEVWPRYVAATGRHPDVTAASLMVQVLGNGLARPDDAVAAARFAAEGAPSSASYLQLVLWAQRAGKRREAVRAAERALALAKPAEREAIRRELRALLSGSW